jgi:hypothetical protein
MASANLCKTSNEAQPLLMNIYPVYPIKFYTEQRVIASNISSPERAGIRHVGRGNIKRELFSSI